MIHVKKKHEHLTTSLKKRPSQDAFMAEIDDLNSNKRNSCRRDREVIHDRNEQGIFRDAIFHGDENDPASKTEL